MPARALLLLLLAFCASASEPGSFERTLTVSGPLRLDVSSLPGGLSVSPGPAGSVHIRATLKPLYSRFDFDLAEAHIRALEKDPPVQQVGDLIRLGYPANPALLRAVTIHYEITAPPDTQLLAQTHSGGVEVTGLSRPVTITTTSGRIVATRLSAPLLARTQSGSVDFEDLSGPTDVESTSGSMKLSRLTAPLRAVTRSGSLQIEDAAAVIALNQSGRIHALRLSGPLEARATSGAIQASQLSPNPVQAQTRSGSIKLQLVPNAGYQLDAESHSGRIHAPLPGPSNAHKLKGPIRSGGPLLHLRTKSSEIRVD